MTNLQTRSAVLLFTAIVGVCFVLEGARSQNGSGPDPREIPVPAIRTALKPLPGVKDLPVRAAMPDVMLMNDGTRVTTPAQWRKRRVEMKRILEYYFAGLAPPAPSNVKGREIKSQMVLDGKVKYRLIHLTFGPKESLGLDIGVFTPVTGGPFPALIMPGGTPPGRLLCRVCLRDPDKERASMPCSPSDRTSLRRRRDHPPMPKRSPRAIRLWRTDLRL